MAGFKLMAINNRPGRDIFSEDIIQEQINVPASMDIGGADMLLPEPLPPVREQMGKSFPYRDYAGIPFPEGELRRYKEGWNEGNPFLDTTPRINIVRPGFEGPERPFPVKGVGQKYEEEYLKKHPFPDPERTWLDSFLEQIGLAGGGGIAGIQNLQTGGHPDAEWRGQDIVDDSFTSQVIEPEEFDARVLDPYSDQEIAAFERSRRGTDPGPVGIKSGDRADPDYAWQNILADTPYNFPNNVPSELIPKGFSGSLYEDPIAIIEDDTKIVSSDPLSTINGVSRSAPVEPFIEGTANPYLEAASAWPPLSYGQSGFIPEELRGIRKRGGDESIIEALKGAGPGYNPGSWVIRGGPVGSVRELDELEGQIKDRYEESGIGPVWSGSGGLSALKNLPWGDFAKNVLLAALSAKAKLPLGLFVKGGEYLSGKFPPSSYEEEEIIEPWEVMEDRGRAQGGLISLAHGGNPSVYQAGENIEKLLATKMGYEGNKYSGVPNQQGMINTVNQGIGDNVKSGLRSIIANAYAQGNVPAPSVPQYNQAQLLNKGLTMLPNTANTPVPQQPQQPPAQGNISNVYAQSTLPQSHYMQPNQVT
jgi:hypothetical protein